MGWCEEDAALEIRADTHKSATETHSGKLKYKHDAWMRVFLSAVSDFGLY